MDHVSDVPVIIIQKTFFFFFPKPLKIILKETLEEADLLELFLKGVSHIEI